MIDILAEQLLSIELDWDTRTAKDEINKLKFLAAVKYDNYCNFGPGKRFMESLILWLRQLKTKEEREIAYHFVMNRMLYISETQIDHLVDLMYPQRVLPIILDQARKTEGIPLYQKRRISDSETFQILSRKTLFLGLSDGARVDSFRRKHALNNEQVSVSCELSEEKWSNMHSALREWLKERNNKSQAAFENIFLIDDFTGSGNSILRIDKNQFKGKLPKFIDQHLGKSVKPCKLGECCTEAGPRLYVITYLGTESAIKRLREDKEKLLKQKDEFKLSSCEILDPLQKFEDWLKVPQPDNNFDQLLNQVLDKYYDDGLEDVHTKTGGTDVKHGYAGCALPLVLCHNCPNNSIYLLWGQTEATKDRQPLNALFPRIARHLEGR